MIFLGDIERCQRFERRHDWIVKDPSFIQLLNISFRNSFLLIVGVKNGGSILPAEVVALTVELCRIMCDGKVNLQQLSECGLTRVVPNFDGLGMIRSTAAHGSIIGSLGRISGVTAADRNHSSQFLKNSFHAPEATTCEHCLLFRR